LADDEQIPRFAQDDTAPMTTPPVDPYGATTPIARAAVSGAEPTAPAPTPKPKTVEATGLSLTAKIFMAVAGTVLLVLVGTLLVGGASSQRAAKASLDAALHQTADLITTQLEADEENMSAKAKIYFSNPAVRADIEKLAEGAPKDTVDFADLLDLSQQVDTATGASWVQLTDANGTRIARSDQPSAQPVDLSESPLIAAALNGETAHSFGLTSDSVLFDAVAIPIEGAGRVVGTAMLARNFTDSTAARIKMLTGSDVVFFAIDSTGDIRIVGATGRFISRETTSGILTTLIKAKKLTANSVETGQMLMSMQMDTAMKSTMPQVSEIDGHSYIWTIRPLQTGSGRAVGGVLAARDEEEALKPFTDMQRAVLIAGAIALGLAFLISFLFARQITQPVRGLVEATRRAAEGDYAAQIPAAKGEIGALASAFNLLLEDLREKQALVDFLQGTSGGKTVAAQAARMGMGTTGATVRGMGAGRMLSSGETLANRYEIKKVLGAGGMGMVYKALDRELGETVAVKTLRPEFMEADSNALERFRSEIRLARRISHRNVVRTHDIGEVDGLYFITMEFVEGSSLKDLIVSRGRLPAAAVVSIGKQLCRALEVAHEAGVIHRDIKPQNMVVESDGTLKVMDFGIARLQARSDGHTQAGMVVGTPEYMSPEQLRGDELDGRSDLYSAGVVLYESLTGRLPLTADTPASLIGKVLTEIPVAPRASVAEVSPLLSSSIMQALEKDREKRPRTALEFLSILDRA
jgi:HAMP domain-containing protein/predicted Ser/Thr protein kinase